MSKEDIYIELAERYGWTDDEIAEMNPHNQLVFYRGKKIQSMSPEQYQEFLKNRRR